MCNWTFQHHWKSKSYHNLVRKKNLSLVQDCFVRVPSDLHPVLNWRIFGVELTVFRCWTKLALNWGVRWSRGRVELRGLFNRIYLGVELTIFGVQSRSVLNWGVCWTEGFLVFNWRIIGAEKVLCMCCRKMFHLDNLTSILQICFYK